MSPIATLTDSDLFGALGTPVLDNLARLMSQVSFAPGELVFKQGDRGDRLILVSAGELEAMLEVPGAPPVRLSSIGSGQIVGELSLLGDGVRTATVRAVRHTTGWALARPAFDLLRQDVRPAATAVVRAIGGQGVVRLSQLYGRCAGELEGEPVHECSSQQSIGEVSPECGEIDYLAGVLCFRGLTHAQIAEVTDGLPRLAIPRGAILTPVGELPAALWVVVRGAVETRMRGASRARSLRLAGPGRLVGHIGLLGQNAPVARVESRARERSVLIEIPWPRVNELLESDAPASLHFAAALWTDVVRALQHGERPLARTRTTRTPRQAAISA